MSASVDADIGMPRKRIAVVSPYSPGTRDAGEKVRLSSLLEELASHHEVVLFTWEREAEVCSPLSFKYEARKPSAVLQVDLQLTGLDYVRAALGGSLVQWSRTRRLRKIRSWLAEELGALQPDVILASQLTGLAAVPTALRNKVLVDTHNAEGLRWRRIAQAQSWGLRRVMARQQARAATALERRMGKEVSTMLVVSDADARYFGSLGCTTDLVPNGFCPPQGGPKEPGWDAPRLLFIGSFNYSANRDALTWLVDIMPTLPTGVGATVAGSGDPAPIKAMFAGSPNVNVVGRVTNVAELYMRHNVLFVPLRMGGGSRLKILEATSHRLAVISTRVGAEGLPLVPGEDFLLAETTADWGSALSRLFDGQLGSDIAANASAKLEGMTWSNIGIALRQVIDHRC